VNKWVAVGISLMFITQGIESKSQTHSGVYGSIAAGVMVREHCFIVPMATGGPLIMT